MEKNTQQDVMNTLRGLFTPKDDIEFNLIMNKHPKGYKNKSLSYAKNVRVSDDGSVLQNDEALCINKEIKDKLDNVYKNFLKTDYKIIHICPCNNEFVLFVNRLDVNAFEIWRYREDDEENNRFALFYDYPIEYHNGYFSSTFTYTFNNCLIIAFCEVPEDENIMCPLMTINLGSFIKGYTTRPKFKWVNENKENNDRNLESYKLPLQPEVRLPKITSNGYRAKRSYIGWYYPYVRFKINSTDYTQWYSVGYPILNNKREYVTIAHKEHYNKEDNDRQIIFKNNEKKLTDIPKDKDEVSLLSLYESNKYNYETLLNDKNNVVENCLNLDFNFDLTTIKYDYVQIGFICTAKEYQKYFISKDIQLTNKINIDVSLNTLIEENFKINEYQNFYNVKNILNYKNKIYISNYKVFNENINVYTDNIKVDLVKTYNVNKDKFIKKEDYDVDYIKESLYYKKVLNVENYKFYNILYKDTTSRLQPVSNATRLKDSHNVNLYSIYLFLKLIDFKGEDITKQANIEIILYDDNGLPYDKKVINFLLKDLYIGKGNRYKATYDNIRISDLKNYYGYVEYKNSFYTDIDTSFYLYIKNNEQSEKDNIILPFRKNEVTHYPGSNLYDISEIVWYNDAYINREIKLNIGNKSINLTKDKDLYLDKIDYTLDIDSIISDYFIFNEDPKNILNLSGLIPGEVYDFYIHFIDKYGNVTKGKKLINNSEYITLINTNIHLSCLTKINDENLNDYYWFKSDDKIFNDDNTFKIDKDYITNNVYKGTVNNNILDPINLNNDEIDYIYDCLIDLTYLKNKNLTFEDILDDSYDLRFLHFKNSENVDFFKIPNTIEDEKNYLGLQLSNIYIPEDYVSYFISYAEYNNRIKLTGLGDYNKLLNDYIINNKDDISGDIIRLYSIDITDQLINKEGYVPPADKDVSYDFQKTIKIDKYINKYNTKKFIGIQNNSIIYAGESQKKRGEKTSAISFKNYNEDNLSVQEFLMIDILNVDKNIYTSKNITLYRLGNILTNDNEIISNGYDGTYCDYKITVYGNSQNNIERGCKVTGDYFNISQLFGYVFFFELYTMTNHPVYSLYMKEHTHTNNKNIFSAPIDLLTLYDVKTNKINEGNPNFYFIQENDNTINEFNNTIYRSNVISDESIENNWRFFEPTEYKTVAENKGAIVALALNGSYFYIHTQHSLFVFSDDNTIRSGTEQIQLGTIDIFNIDYKEIFSTNLGFGGIAKKHHGIIGSYGYIYYNHDNKEIIYIKGNGVDVISIYINEYLKLLDIKDLHVCDDKYNNRLLFVIELTDENQPNICLSFNYKTLSFVSFHDINNINLGYNTKDNLYLTDNKYIYNFKHYEYGYNEKINNINEIIKLNKDYQVAFIINRSYEQIKYLENISYKLYKKNRSDINNVDPTTFPVEKNIIPYSGNKLRIFNDICDTNELDIDAVKVDNNTKPYNDVTHFDKPFYELGVWNFNLIRNNIINSLNADDKSRIYGNYFIIMFTFNGGVQNNELIQFEELNVNLTQDK